MSYNNVNNVNNVNNLMSQLSQDYYQPYSRQKKTQQLTLYELCCSVSIHLLFMLYRRPMVRPSVPQHDSCISGMGPPSRYGSIATSFHSFSPDMSAERLKKAGSQKRHSFIMLLALVLGPPRCRTLTVRRATRAKSAVCAVRTVQHLQHGGGKSRHVLHLLALNTQEVASGVSGLQDNCTVHISTYCRIGRGPALVITNPW